MVKNITIQDVAKKCGVSVATVSRVLNENENVKSETRDKILKIVKELDYQPNYIGRNLRAQNTKLILVLLPTIVNPFFAKLVKGMEDASRDNGYNIVMCTTYEDKRVELSHLNMLRSKLFDGVIFIKSALSPNELKEFAKHHHVVQCSEYYENIGIPYVSIDNEQAGYDATKHLIECGCKNILEMSVNNKAISTKKRHTGYMRALDEASLPYDEKNIIFGNYGYRSAVELLNRKIADGTKFDGIFAISDRMAAGCIRSLHENNIKVPFDVKVVGFDNIDIARMINPEITTISQSQYEMGYSSVDILIKKIKGEPFSEDKKIIKYNLIKRKSSEV